MMRRLPFHLLLLHRIQVMNPRQLLFSILPFLFPLFKLYVCFKYIKNPLPLTAIAPFSPVGSVSDSFITNVPSEFTFTLSFPLIFTKNISVDGVLFSIKERDDVNAPVNSTEPVI